MQERVLRKELAVLLSIAKFKLKMENISSDYGYSESWRPYQENVFNEVVVTIIYFYYKKDCTSFPVGPTE